MKATREHLVHLLTEASEIEHNLLCSYVYAAVSLKRKHEGLSPGEGDAVERWRQSVMGIAFEEMAHLALVNNLLVSVGGAACFDRPNFPIPPGYHPANIVIRLTPFSEATLAHFVYLEHPEDIDIQDHPDFTSETHYTRLPVGYGLTPSTPDYATVGGFYAAIRAAICQLADSEAALFVGASQSGQAGPTLVKLPGLVSIVDKASALTAIDTIVEQGEGASKHRDGSHYARFRAIQEECHELRVTNPAFEPAWPAASDPVMRKPPVPECDRVWVTDDRSAELLDFANATYGLTLSFLEQAYASASSTDERRAYLGAATGLMRAVASTAEMLARRPAGPEYRGVNAGMTFAVPRNLRPRNPAVANRMLLERVQALRGRAREVLECCEACFVDVERKLEELHGRP